MSNRIKGFLTLLLVLLAALFYLFPAATAAEDETEGDSIDGAAFEIPHHMLQIKLSEDGEWQPYKPLRSGSEGSVWIRISPIPDFGEASISIFFYPAPQQIELYQNGRLLQTIGSAAGSDPRVSRVTVWKIVDGLSPDLDTELRIEGRAPFLLAAGSKPALIFYMLRTDAAALVSLLLFLIVGTIAFVLFLLHRRIRLLAWFSLFTLVHYCILPAGTLLLSKQLLFQLPLMGYFYWYLIGNIADSVLMLLLLRELVDPTIRRWANAGVTTTAAAGLLAVGMVSLLPGTYSVVMGMTGIYVVFVVKLFLITLTAVSLRRRRNGDLLLFLIGIICFIAAELAVAVSQILLSVSWSSVFRLASSLTMLLPGAIIIARRYRQLEREAKQTLSDLEERVRQRTQQLQTAHEQITEQLQENAAAEAEIAALEERNRIAKEIHDIVGHTLTTTVMQLEAGQRFLRIQDTEQASMRIELSQQLVRKGLDEIRTSVRRLSDAEWSHNLTEALKGLLEETKANAGVSVGYEIEEKLPELSLSLKNLLYLSLREGLTNGLKHGRSTVFKFKLYRKEAALVFRLSNNGIPYRGEANGFGIQAMKRRVSQLGGTFALTYEADNVGAQKEGKSGGSGNGGGVGVSDGVGGVVGDGDGLGIGAGSTVLELRFPIQE